MPVGYHIYANTGVGDPINYAAPIATVEALTWTSSTLASPGTWSFSVRAFDTVSGLEDQNVDCAVTMILDSAGQDITNQPRPPTGVRAFALAGGSLRIEWAYPVVNRASAPAGFHIYMGTGGVPDYSSPAATVLFESGIANSFVSTVPSLSDGVTYTVGVRAYNATSEEKNTNTVSVMADATGPSAVFDLTVTANS